MNSYQEFNATLESFKNEVKGIEAAKLAYQKLALLVSDYDRAIKTLEAVEGKAQETLQLLYKEAEALQEKASEIKPANTKFRDEIKDIVVSNLDANRAETKALVETSSSSTKAILDENIASTKAILDENIASTKGVLEESIASTKGMLEESLNATKAAMQESFSGTRAALEESLANYKSALDESVANTANLMKENFANSQSLLDTCLSDTRSTLSESLASTKSLLDSETKKLSTLVSELGTDLRVQRKLMSESLEKQKRDFLKRDQRLINAICIATGVNILAMVGVFVWFLWFLGYI